MHSAVRQLLRLSPLSKLDARLAAWLERRSAFLTRPGAARAAMWMVPLLFGLLSLALGQDDNWDLKNYHLYNAYALLNGRLGVDLAPGQWQSYFNPTLDLLYYGLMAALPAPLAGFVMGVLHGLNFVLVLAIARLLLPAPAAADIADRQRLPLLLALAGLLGAGFLAELGNSMGDNMMALLVLSSLYLVLAHWPRWTPAGFDRRALALLLASGLVMGLGTGLKLTNATYALALCLALLALDGGFWHRIRLAFVFGIGVLAGLAATAGHWFWTMWQSFGNPLFPQFNALFRSPLAARSGVLDLDHLPRSLGEALLWPFVFTRDFHRVSELVLKQTIWPVMYVLFLAFGARLLLQWLRRGGAVAAIGTPSPRARFTMLFFALGYLGWLKLFGIYRYLLPLELLAPLMVWLLLHGLLKAPAARVAGRWILLLTTIAVFPFVTWGHTSWAREGFSVSDPGIADPAASMVYTAHAHPPMGWTVKYLPPQLAVVSLGGGFPESPGYVARVQAIAASRSGPHYVMLAAHANHEEVTLARKNAVVQALGLTGSAPACARLAGWMKKVRFHADVQMLDPGHCQLVLQPQYRQDLPAMDRAVVAAATASLGRYGVTVQPDSCRRHAAAIGAEPAPYQLCRVTESRPAR
jgi:hypothetical protein